MQCQGVDVLPEAYALESRDGIESTSEVKECDSHSSS